MLNCMIVGLAGAGISVVVEVVEVAVGSYSASVASDGEPVENLQGVKADTPEHALDTVLQWLGRNKDFTRYYIYGGTGTLQRSVAIEFVKMVALPGAEDVEDFMVSVRASVGNLDYFDAIELTVARSQSLNLNQTVQKILVAREARKQKELDHAAHERALAEEENTRVAAAANRAAANDSSDSTSEP